MLKPCNFTITKKTAKKTVFVRKKGKKHNILW